MDALRNRVGPYLYADGMKAEKVFDFDRTFSVVVYGAFDANGLIGPEVNGILVLDEDNRSVVLDGHRRETSGYHGPSRAQVAEFERIKAMDWAEFSRFCHDHPRYRGASPDITSLTGPDVGDPLERAIASGKPSGRRGTNILPPEMLSSDWSPAPTHTTREDIVVFLANHHAHVPMNDNNGGFVVAWDIKVRGRVDMSGSHGGSVETDPEFDAAWKEHADAHSDELWSSACDDALHCFLSGEFSTPPGDDAGDYGFATNGRSGGHLILTEWKGHSPPGGGWASCPMAFSGRQEYIEWLKDMPVEELGRFYKLVASVDAATDSPEDSISFQMSCIRSGMENEWRAEAKRNSRATVGMSPV